MIFRMVTLVLLGIIGGYLGYMAADREPPLQLDSMHAIMPTEPSKIVRFSYTGYRKRLCDVYVARFLLDPAGVRFTLPSFSYPAYTNTTGPETYTTQLSLPSGVTEGRATYRTVNCYVCNPLHHVIPICTGPRDIAFTISKTMAEEANR